jgi:hypothetical protein
MNTDKLNTSLKALIAKRQILGELGYDDPKYDKIEEELEEMEQDFLDIYGDFLEKAIQKSHDVFCPNTDLLSPTAYIPRKYQVFNDEDLGIESFEVGNNDGAIVDLEDFPNLEARMLLLPDPLRIVIVSAAGDQEVWRAS